MHRRTVLDDIDWNVVSQVGADTCRRRQAVGSRQPDAQSSVTPSQGGNSSAATAASEAASQPRVSPCVAPPLPAQAVGSRSNVQCLEKWYAQLAPDMIDQGEWSGADDRRLLRALYQR